MLVQVIKGHNKSTLTRSWNTQYNLMVNHVLRNKHTDGIINDNVAHGNQVCLDIQHHSWQYVIVTWQENTCSSRCIFAANYVLNFKIDNAYESLRGREVHDHNTHAECNAAQLIVEFENISIYNDSPTRTDGRGVSTGRFNRYASNLVGLKRYLALVGIKGTASRIAHNSLY